MKRWVVVILVASLVVNVFLLGIIAGTVWHWTHDRGMGFRGGWRMRVADALPDGQGQALRKAIHEAVRKDFPALREGRADRAEAARLFVQPQFDANAINAKLDAARASDMALRADLEHSMIQFAAGLPLDQRKKMAEALKDGPFRQGPPHPPGMGGGPEGPGGPGGPPMDHPPGP